VSDFNKSVWADHIYAQNYLNKADIYVMERRKMFWFVSSLCSHFFHARQPLRLLELGFGDGALTEELLRTNNSMSVTLLDGGEGMLEKARERLKIYQDIGFIEATFQELLGGSISLETYDLCVSSMAIHHLEMAEKASLFRLIASCLNPGGRFVNVDVVLPPSGELEGWYFDIWGDWLSHMMQKYDIRDETPEDLMRRYKDPSTMNRPDTLEDQLKAMNAAGFAEVDCYFKSGIFVVFGGKRE
jgi:tRNA (cmo5U34)-methyltransferase